LKYDLQLANRQTQKQTNIATDKNAPDQHANDASRDARKECWDFHARLQVCV